MKMTEKHYLKYYLNLLLEVERELVIGDEAGQAPQTLRRIRRISDEIVTGINREEEKQMIAQTLLKF